MVDTDETDWVGCWQRRPAGEIENAALLRKQPVGKLESHFMGLLHVVHIRICVSKAGRVWLDRRLQSMWLRENFHSIHQSEQCWISHSLCSTQ